MKEEILVRYTNTCTAKQEATHTHTHTRQFRHEVAPETAMKLFSPMYQSPFSDELTQRNPTVGKVCLFSYCSKVGI